MNRKLEGKGIAPGAIPPVLDQLAREGLQSDRRFTEAYLDSRARKGYGPVRLRQELRERGVEDTLIDSCLDVLDIDWMDALQSVRVKKFGSKPPASYREQAKEARFLQYRGFSTDQISRLYKDED